MAPLSSPYKVGMQGINRRSASPLPPPPQLPPKAIDLNSSTRSTDQASGQKITRRAFICDVVVENEGEDTAVLLSHLGRPLIPPSTLPSVTTSLNRSAAPSREASDDENEEGGSSRAWSPKKREDAARRLHSLVEELVRTERSYLMRIKALKTSYADPLRSFAKDKHTQIIPLYEAKNLFANIDQVVPASMSFLADLEAMWASGKGVDHVGDVCLRHLKDLSTFAPFRTYLSKHDEVQKLFQEALKKYSGFSSFIDSTKYQTTGIGNIGLRELLMEPVQRIPRYTLLWQTMIKAMAPMAPQRSKLMEAIDIASRIAKCEPDAQIIRATVMYCLQRNVEDFPADLFSNKRDYLDSLDVDDVPVDFMSPSNSHTSRPMSTFSTTSASTPSLASIGSSVSSSQLPTSPNGYNSSLSNLHCTLFLFNDKLIIVKRQSSAVSGRKVTGLDDVAKLVKTGGGVAVMDKGGAKKDKLSYRGIVDILDVIASDTGNGDFHLFFERPPVDQTDRWSARPFRSYTSVHPPYSSNLDSVAIRKDKLRFIHNLWAAQTVARANLLPKEIEPPRPMEGEYEVGLEGAGEIFGRAKCFWSVWDKKGWSVVGKRAKVVVHIDEAGTADDLVLSEDTGPCMLIRLQPLSGGLCRISYATLADEEEDREVINMGDATDKIATIIHRYGIFKFRTSNASAPNTPSSSSHRLRPSMMNLDTISRNLFGAGAPSIRSQGSSVDAFGTGASKRKPLSRSATESSRMSTTSSTSDNERLKRLSRLSSSSAEDREEADEELDEPGNMKQSSPYKVKSTGAGMGQSEIDLNERLQLARKNSKSMAALSPRPSKRMETRSQGDMKRGRSEEPQIGMSTADTILANLPLGPPSTLQISTTAPLRVRNKTPSPTRPFTMATLPQLPQIATQSPFTLRRPVLGSDASGLGYISSLPPIEYQSVEPSTPTPLSPRQGMLGPRSPTMTGPRSPLISSFTPTPRSPLLGSGPRSPGPRPLPAPPAAIGSAHTRLRVTSGTGRKVSAGRETIPLKVTDMDASRPSTPSERSTTPTMLVKRQHSEDYLTPRKRSLTRSPLEPIPSNNDLADLPDPLTIPASFGRKPKSPLPGGLGIGLGSAPRSGNRTASGNRTPRKTSGQHLTPTMGTVRRASGASLAGSINSNGTGVSEDVEMVDHPDVLTALNAGVQRVTESKAAAKRLRVEVVALKKQLARDNAREVRSMGGGGGGNQGSMPRSPQRRNMNRLLDLDGMSDYGAPIVQPVRHATTVMVNAKHELENTVAEERLRGMVAVAERLEGGLKAALGDLEVGRGLVNGLLTGMDQKSSEVEGMRAQVNRAKEQQELLRTQLGDAQIEVDTIYEAFNTELDGMFNDAQLPPTEAFMALREDLQSTKNERNGLRLENTRLRRELEEANLKREQWAKILREHGVIH